jgi:hypothetical protein
LALLQTSDLQKPEPNDPWSPLQFGFGLDMNLNYLLAAIRPNEYLDYVVTEKQSNENLEVDNGEWDGTKSIFPGKDYLLDDVDYYTEVGWGTNALSQQAELEANFKYDQGYSSNYNTLNNISASDDEQRYSSDYNTSNNISASYHEQGYSSDFSTSNNMFAIYNGNGYSSPARHCEGQKAFTIFSPIAAESSDTSTTDINLLNGTYFSA